MRAVFAVAVLLGAGALAAAQPQKDPEPRYGIKPRLKQFGQANPKESLRSALTALEKGEYSYLVAHLMEPKFVDDAVTERAKLFEAGAERDLANLRDFQLANPTKFAPETRVPLDPVAFRAMSAAKARELGFKQLVKDVTQKLADDPQAAKDFRRMLTDGAFADAAGTASATHPAAKGRTVYFKNIDGRWFLENRQSEEKKEP